MSVEKKAPYLYFGDDYDKVKNIQSLKSGTEVFEVTDKTFGIYPDVAHNFEQMLNISLKAVKVLRVQSYVQTFTSKYLNKVFLHFILLVF